MGDLPFGQVMEGKVVGPGEVGRRQRVPQDQSCVVEGRQRGVRHEIEQLLYPRLGSSL